MNNETIDAQKFCKMPQIDIKNIYLGPKNILPHCSCPPPPLYLESEPIDEEYLNDSRYVSQKHKEMYKKEYLESIKEQYQYDVYDYLPTDNFNEEIHDEYNETYVVDTSDDEDENDDRYIDDGEFELVRK